MPLPGRVIAFSPWLDMENKGETLVTNDATDALITVALLEGMIAGVLGEAVSPTTPLANPLYADFAGFPRLYINAGGAESLLDNATRLARPGRGGRGRRHPLGRRGPAARLPVHRRPHRRGRRRDRRDRQVVPPADRPSSPHPDHETTQEHTMSTRPSPRRRRRLRRHRHRRRLRRHLHAAQAAQRARPDRPGVREGRRRRRHLVLQPLPGRQVRHRGLRLPLLLRQGPAAGVGLDHPLPRAARHPRLPQPRRRPLRPAPRHPAEHRGHRRACSTRHATLWRSRTGAGEEFTSPLPGQRRSACSRRPTSPTSRAATRFAGALVHTNAWPEDLDITGKRVGRDRHRLHRHPVHRRRRQDRRPPDRLPALAAVLRAVGQRPGGPGRGRPRPRRTSTRSGTRSATPSSPSASRRAASRR